MESVPTDTDTDTPRLRLARLTAERDAADSEPCTDYRYVMGDDPAG